jgi:uncharacterized protein (DUF488 family)
MAAPPLFTIGYEGTTVASVIAALRAAGVQHLLDVRAVPNSRKPGFSRRQLAASVLEAGLQYTHLQALGTPRAGRDAVRRGEVPTMQRIFNAHLQTAEPQAELARAVAISREAPACLLCYERDHRTCHRDILAGLIVTQTHAAVTHLLAESPGPAPGTWQLT